MPTKKKSTPKFTEPAPLYTIGQKYWTIIYHKEKPEDLWEVRITEIRSRKRAIKDELGKTTGMATSYMYKVDTPDGFQDDLYEEQIIPHFVEAAKRFATAFLTLLK